MTNNQCEKYSLIPPFVLEYISDNCDECTNQYVLKTLGHVHHLMDTSIKEDITLREEEIKSDGKLNRVIYDAQNKEEFPGKTLSRSEGMPEHSDIVVNEAYEYFGKTYEFYKNIFGRNSLDNKGMKLIATVHYGKNYLNAFWSRKQMVFGDGDGKYFNRFSSSIDVIAHELTHGVIESEANLFYAYESGALNESISDVFGIMVKQYANNQKYDESDWLVGQGLLGSSFNPDNKSDVALRSFINPGKAFTADKQVGHMDQYENMPFSKDNGGVHILSGIPNRAFYLAAIALGGYTWEKAGKIWYETLLDERLSSFADFEDFAKLTIENAEKLFSKETSTIISNSWKEVGILV
ncbi:peptidase M4 family protein [Xenorhabdus nematophila]|uniref:M4 family metallopeptidase n=1 Tax=Xenorhabdus nematophila TaxID=628 RepID=UPI000543314E|nr:M4 family metallopeptidase [Xenorhabdus nematophila]CEF32860.1 Extracellular metalloprotease precursor [Xenorhabdus nematophila str. Websteri]AYA39484.1 peptidase M4 family protein [Xenorhabdus nematophila]MBA0018051.1 peptidase M4 family protein [Xenorhabdus nematophila]MCB4424555.1 peptidase M4 family protein [Xenorhabdus nematophila]QNJ37133.1 peptidase M4 family protein [Xenorhabdus nematophila]